ncbi:pimeloyl-ACP methyl ester esterase BioH [Rheinheimera sp. YQF-2]|uniref:Pimeloyl-[acyl-carrier protein] methyl ester esterase n=2 Tax=Rheinheimera lutimaris TaxID=2740584 RepID=A0A7Y5ATP9_9GAMM|nr:pimeloyl-ACP methyl ester esterase BioH [Rheinheimera lutimaris]
MAGKMSSDKPTLVLLHGWGVNHGVWQGITEQIAARVQLLTPDLPGFGMQQSYPQPYRLDAVVDELAANIPPHSYVCGWSLGGLLALAIATRYPDKVQQLGLVAASPCFLTQPGWPGMAEPVMQQFARSLSENLQQTIERFLAIQAMGSSSARADTKLLKQAIMAYPMAQPAAVAGALQLLSQCDLRAEFAALKQPVSGIFGRLDSLVPAAVVAQLQQLQPSAGFTVLPHASHAPFISHPAEFGQWLQQWLGLSGQQS